MLIFKQIKFKNLLSYSNVLTTFDFSSKNNVTLIQGKNGSGKSALIEAIYFALFGVPYRKITIKQLFNSINKKDLYVELYLEFKNKEYKIERGKNPDIFRIYEDGKLIPEASTVNLYQELLLNKLNINEKVFNQTVIRTLTKNLTFVELSKAERREIIENIFSLNVFSFIKESLSEDLKIVDRELNNYTAELNENSSLLREEREHIDKIEAYNMKAEEELKLKSEDEKNRISLEINDTEKSLEELTETFNKNYNDTYTKMNETLQINSHKLQELSKKVSTKKTTIESISNVEDRKLKLLNYKSEIEGKINEEKLRVLDYNNKLSKIREYESKMRELENSISNIKIDEIIRAEENNYNNLKLKDNLNIELSIYDAMLANVCANCERAPIFKSDKVDKIRERISKISLVDVDYDSKIKYDNTLESINKLKDLIHSIDAKEPEIDDTNRDYIKKIENKLTDLDTEFLKLKGDLLEINSAESKMIELNNDESIKLYESNLSSMKNNYEVTSLNLSNTIQKLKKDLTSEVEFKPIQIDKSKMIEYAKRIRVAEEKLLKLNNDRAIMNELKGLIVNDTLKNYVIKSYLPLINRILLEYLDKLKTGIKFNFDEDFEMNIATPYKENLSYYNFSEGQKKKINLAIMFTFIKFLKQSNKYSESNLLILDEISSGLDNDSEVLLNNLILDEVKGTNKEVIIINHSRLADNTKFRRFIVEKQIYSEIKLIEN